MRGSSVKYLTREGFRNIRVNRLMSFASVTVLMACLLIMGAALMVFFNIDSALDRVQSQNVIMVYIEDNATEEETVRVGEKLRSLENVASCEFVSKEEAFRQQIESMGGDAAVFEGFEKSPLPDAYKVTVKDLSAFDSTANGIRALDKVLRVRENSELTRQLMSLRRAVTLVGAGLVVLLFLVAVFIIANTIRITMFSRRLEIHIMKAVGAAGGFIRLPFFVEGVVLGLISGAVAWGLLWGLYELAGRAFAGAVSVLDFSMVPFLGLWWQILLLFLGIGIFTGGFGSIVSMGKYLKEQESVVSDE